jgi:hypothetical protein
MNRVGLNSWHLLVCLVAAALALPLLGCGPTGPPRYQVEGEVSFNGSPIPKGFIFFTGDVTKQNDAPQTVVRIDAGKFSSSSEKGVVGGPYVVQVKGYDGVQQTGVDMIVPEGLLLFPEVQTKIDLPAHDARLHLKVTGTANEPSLSIEILP